MRKGVVHATRRATPWSTAVVAALCLALPASPAHAAAEKTWTPLVRGVTPLGEASGAAPTSRGTIAVAPESKALAGPPSPYLWGLAVREKKIAGASGDGGEVWLLPEDGSAAKLLHDAAETQAQAVAAYGGAWVAAFNPGGRVLLLRENGKTEPVFDATEGYAWALLPDPKGKALWVAVGSPGRVYRVEGGGKPAVVLESGDGHVRSLALGKDGRLLAGTDGRGLLVRADSEAKRFVLFDAPRREISSISVAADGTIWFAAVGQEEAEAAPAPSPAPGASPAPAATPAIPPLPTDPKKGPPGQLYRMRPDGFAELVWTAPGPSILAVLARGDGAWAATGDPGAIYGIEADGASRKLFDPSAGQTTSLFEHAGDVLVTTANPAKAFRLQTARRTAATFDGAPLDAGGFARWGRLTWEATGGAATILTRSGNTATPDASWSAWSGSVATGSSVASPPARYLQWRVQLPADGKTELTRLEAIYRVENRAPKVDWIVLEEPGVTLAPKADAPPSYTLPPENKPTAVRKELPSKRGYARGWRAARWAASDPDGDDLTFDVLLRGAGETAWKPIAKNLPEGYTTWDATSFPDGRYELKIIASDDAVNGPAAARAGERVHGPFESDTTPPRVSDVDVKDGRIRAAAADGQGVAGASFAVDGGEWSLMSADDGLSDGESEKFSAPLPALPKGEHTIVVRAIDRAGNPGSGKVTVK